MDIRQLETLLRIVETGSFAGAADALCATQSTVSARIGALERSLGVELFDRSSHRARLTPKGQELLKPAQEIVALAARVRHQIGNTQVLTGTVRMGVVGLVALTWLPRLMSAVRDRYPGVTVVLDIALTAALIDKLRDGEIDLAIVTGPADEPSTSSVPLGHDEFVWIAASTLNLPTERMTPRELARWPVLGLSSQSHHYPVIERWFRAGGAEFKPVISCNTVRVLGDLTLAGLGVSLLPRHSYTAEIAAGRLTVLNTEPRIGPVEFVALYRTSATNPLTSAIAALATEISEFAGNL
ncbi:LysR family transcriptional regulator [Paraburkholderia solisilvae]|uniref:HTH-type transcriptional regulator YofA n=1 Tax=Paraburkholderia solisilvae TaxID=624376 RepID=A0A6J5CUB0_9BURK|nr:LysR family transcriptional regulator [Paraburkholderia solisilvae]CAB3745750.1 HTH-type transcriptional regulator YofA [Paraburkholderia solisilvae]